MSVFGWLVCIELIGYLLFGVFDKFNSIDINRKQSLPFNFIQHGIFNSLMNRYIDIGGNCNHSIPIASHLPDIF